MRIHEEILRLMNQIEEVGEEIYIVGGFVRDFMLQRKTYDLDLSTSMDLKDLKKIINPEIFKISSINEEYGNINLEFMSYHIEISQFRLEYFYKDSRHPEKIDFIKSAHLDARRRDFTINSLYMNSQYEIIDFHDSFKDLNNRMIKTIRCPHIVFSEDALRIVRMYRFKSELDFKLDDDTRIAAKRNMHKIEELNRISLKEESIKILGSKGFQNLYLEDVDFLKLIFPKAQYPKMVFASKMLWEYRLILMHDFKSLKIILKDWEIPKSKTKYILKMKELMDDYSQMDMNTLFLKHGSFYFFELMTFLNKFQEDFVYRRKYLDMIRRTKVRSIKDLEISGKELIECSIPAKDRQSILNQLLFDVLWNHTDNTKKALKENLARYKHDIY